MARAHDPNESDEAFRDRVRAWMPPALAEAQRVADASGEPDALKAVRDAWGEILYRDGYRGLAWPKEYGGQDLPGAKVAIFYEECSRHHAPAEPNRIGINLSGPAIIAAGTRAQKERYLRPILTGEEIWCEGFSEPNAGSDLAAASTTARFDGEKFIINGSKIWTSHAQHAKLCYLLTKTSEDAPRHHNLTVFLFNMKQPGVEVRPLRQINGRADFNQVFFTDAVATLDEVLGEVNGGWRLSSISSGSLRATSVASGIWHHYGRMNEYLDRLQAAAEAQGIEEPTLPDYRERLDLLWWHIARAANMVEAADRFLKPHAPTPVIKLLWSKLCQDIAATGLANDYPPDRAYWRQAYFEARPVTLFAGSVQLQRNVIADQVLSLRKR